MPSRSKIGWNSLRRWLQVCALHAKYHAGARRPQHGEFWEDFRHSFDPALVEDVLLADRGDRAKGLLQALQAGTGITQFI